MFTFTISNTSIMVNTQNKLDLSNLVGKNIEVNVPKYFTSIILVFVVQSAVN
jgi:hypothetical protein